MVVLDALPTDSDESWFAEATFVAFLLTLMARNGAVLQAFTTTFGKELIIASTFIGIANVILYATVTDTGIARLAETSLFAFRIAYLSGR